MPTYQYRCTDCGTDLEVFQKFTDTALTECPTCEGSLRKVFNAVGVVFKGSGFYRTDSRPKNGSDAAGSGPSGAESASPSGSGSSEKAPATGSEPAKKADQSAAKATTPATANSSAAKPAAAASTGR